MADRIYYTDATATEFDAEVLEVLAVQGHPAAILDRTAFYPTSGGQPNDTGMLGTARVTDVIDREDGEIVHVLDAPLAPGPVSGRIDWDRRFEHMQQHTGQHILSAACEKELGARTVSFHLGTERSTIDVSRDIPIPDLARAALEANRVVWENRPVSVRFVSDDEAATLPLRKEPRRTGRLRLVDVADYDLSACGGTHVSRTGEIGLIAVSGTEKYKGGTRVEFVCGIRALRAFDGLRDTVIGSVRHLSVLPAELPDGIARVQAEARESQRAIRNLQEKLAGFEAQALVARAVPAGGWRAVVERADWDAAGLKALAASAATAPRLVAVLFNPTGGLVVVSRSADVGLDASAVVKNLIGRFGGRGGGRPELAQAGGLTGAPEAVLDAARAIVAPPGDTR